MLSCGLRCIFWQLMPIQEMSSDAATQHILGRFLPLHSLAVSQVLSTCCSRGKKHCNFVNFWLPFMWGCLWQMTIQFPLVVAYHVTGLRVYSGCLSVSSSSFLSIPLLDCLLIFFFVYPSPSMSSSLSCRYAQVPLFVFA